MLLALRILCLLLDFQRGLLVVSENRIARQVTRSKVVLYDANIVVHNA